MPFACQLGQPAIPRPPATGRRGGDRILLRAALDYLLVLDEADRDKLTCIDRLRPRACTRMPGAEPCGLRPDGQLGLTLIQRPNDHCTSTDSPPLSFAHRGLAARGILTMAAAQTLEDGPDCVEVVRGGADDRGW